MTANSSTRDVREWLGHADSRTTARYVHYRKRSDEAQRLAEAFRVEPPETESLINEAASPGD